MRFEAFEKEFQHAKQLEANINDVGRRKYVLERRPDEYSTKPNELCVDVLIAPFAQQTLMSIIVFDSELGPRNNLDTLSPLNLRRIAQIREDIDRWIAGGIDELPTEMPWEKDLWRP